MRVTFITLLVLATAGCAARRPPTPFTRGNNLSFRGCIIRDQREQKNSCECSIRDLIRNVGEKKWIVVCGEPDRGSSTFKTAGSETAEQDED